MTEHIVIRLAVADDDAAAISGLVYSTSLSCCFSAEQPCPAWFAESVAPGQIATQLALEQMRWLVADVDKALVGVLAVGEKKHVTYFFVHPQWQGLRLGTRLWQAAMSMGFFGDELTVRSSLVAVPVYEHLGFKAVEPPNVFMGLHYQTMAAMRSLPSGA